jgi:hypothetical protein
MLRRRHAVIRQKIPKETRIALPTEHFDSEKIEDFIKNSHFTHQASGNSALSLCGVDKEMPILSPAVT